MKDPRLLDYAQIDAIRKSYDAAYLLGWPISQHASMIPRLLDHIAALTEERDMYERQWKRREQDWDDALRDNVAYRSEVAALKQVLLAAIGEPQP